jgi:predicted Zn-dependent protease
MRSSPTESNLRLVPLTAALTFALAALNVPAQDTRLPDIGSSAGEVLGPAQQAQYGAMTLSQLRHYGYVLDDPLIEGWLQGVGHRLGASSDKSAQSFTFFMLKDRQINAFATLGGYIGTNAGLVLAADREDQVASVLSHEIAHVTQDHVLRGVERAERDSVPILLAMLGAIALAQSSSNSGGDATMAALAAAQGLMAQRMIDYTRANESEADRVGIQTLARSGYDPTAMAEFFTNLQAVVRVNRGGEREQTPDYLQTHPITITRIGEAKERAAQIAGRSSFKASSTGTASDNPMLPAGLRMPQASLAGASSGQFGWARERLRVLSANTPAEAIREYERMRDKAPLDAAQRYGLALARLHAGQATAAAGELATLQQQHPDDTWLALALGEAEAGSGKHDAADRRFEALLARMPRNRAVALTYAKVLGERNNVAAGKRAQAVLRPLAATASDDPVFQETFARASEIAGDPIRAGEAYAEAEYLNGRPERALVQLENLKKRSELDYYARARIDARIAAITPTVLELRRQGVKDEALDRR